VKPYGSRKKTIRRNSPGEKNKPGMQTETDEERVRLSLPLNPLHSRYSQAPRKRRGGKRRGVHDPKSQEKGKGTGFLTNRFPGKLNPFR